VTSYAISLFKKLQNKHQTWLLLQRWWVQYSNEETNQGSSSQTIPRNPRVPREVSTATYKRKSKKLKIRWSWNSGAWKAVQGLWGIEVTDVIYVWVTFPLKKVQFSGYQSFWWSSLGPSVGSNGWAVKKPTFRRPSLTSTVGQGRFYHRSTIWPGR
jgi:hypothetical protein